jgi:hypothetical protein
MNERRKPLSGRNRELRIHPRGFEPLTFGSVDPLLPFGKSRFHPMAIGILASQ